MRALRVSIGADDIAKRIRDRLHGGVGDADAPAVVWRDTTSSVLLHTETLIVRPLEGWLVCQLDAQTDEAQRRQLQLIYFLGREEDAGPNASATIAADTLEAAQIADRWGRDLQRVVWDAILDAIEASINTVSIQIPKQPLTLAGFFLTHRALFVDVVAGDG